MEAGTVDFEDLMDTGDDYPGFGIEKFSPLDSKPAVEEDGVLRTPEHVVEEEDFVITENNVEDEEEKDEEEKDVVSEESGDNADDGEEIADQASTSEVENDIDGDKPGVETPIDNIDKPVDQTDIDEAGDTADVEAVTDVADNGKESEENITDKQEDVEINEEKIDHGANNDEVENGLDKDGSSDRENNTNEDRKHKVTDTVDDLDNDDEPVPKKKKYMLMPKPKMTLWSGKRSDKHRQPEDMPDVTVPDTETQRSESASPVNDTETSREERETSPEERETSLLDERETTVEKNSKDREMGDTKDRDIEDKKEEPEDPHQQSFLSFFNLSSQKGMAGKTAAATDSKEKDFYSRKRLRTRKQVSYVEDVKVEEDDEYEEEDDDEENDEDHELTVSSSQRRRSISKSPGKTAAVNYAKALQNISSKFTPIGMQQAAQKQMIAQQQKIMAQAKLMQMPNLVTDLTGGSNVEAPSKVKGLFECGLCGTFFNTASQFINHQEAAHTDATKKGKSGMETFRCEVCQFVLTNRFAYLEHKRMKHMKNQVSFSCSKCGKSFPYLMDMQKHKETCSGNQAPWCGLCNAKFKNMQDLQVHRVKAHSSPSTRQWLNCVNKSCSYKCLTQHEMKLHIQTKHMINELFPCNAPRCARIFSTREQLNEHKKESHASEFIVQYQCMECKMCYSSKTLLAEHQYLHTMEKLRKCDICMRQFATIALYKRHKEVHAFKGTDQCLICRRWCMDKQELSLHTCSERRSRLTVNRLYYCDICLKEFKADEPMFSHRKEHKKFYQCEECYWECSTEADYFEHREVHGKFTCKECCEELTSETELETHLKAHQYYVKMEEFCDEDENEPVMYLCPNVLNSIKA